ncbi:MAG TPA: hypothetical protein VLB68_28840 [Pyrinomonadaceae bacterium]|nr:hypothetical protein [Pyrinomonadaceae bacterium]
MERVDSPESEKKRYFRHPKVVFVRELDEDRFLVTDMNNENDYVISKQVLKREYEEI